MAELVIGRQGTDHVTVRCHGTPYPDSPYESDRNWVRALVSVRTGGFTASIERACFTTGDLRSLRDRLRTCREAGHGVVEWASLEPWLELRIAVTGGTAAVTGRVRDSMGTRNHLTITDFPTLEPADLARLAAGLDACVSEFPVVN